MANVLYENNINIILIQIDEAHSDAWPMAIKDLLNVEQPKPQQTFEDRVNRANHFVNNYKSPYPVYIDTWNNNFAELFRIWPDNYYCVDNKLKVIAKSEYYLHDEDEAEVIEDCTIFLESLLIK